jgi:hypothetical protein
MCCIGPIVKFYGCDYLHEPHDVVFSIHLLDDVENMLCFIITAQKAQLTSINNFFLSFFLSFFPENAGTPSVLRVLHRRATADPSLRRRGAGLGVLFSSPSPSHVGTTLLIRYPFTSISSTFSIHFGISSVPYPYRVKAGPRGAARRSWFWAAGKQSADRARKRTSNWGVDVLARLVVRWGRRFSRVTSFVAYFESLYRVCHYKSS